MFRRILNTTSLLAVAAAVACLFGALACAGAGSDQPTGSIAQFSADSPAAAPAPGAYQGDYVAPKVAPGAYGTRAYHGPMPTAFRESPQSAEMVKQGKILPLEERLPVPEDVLVMPADDEIGVYGGTMRVTGTSLFTLTGGTARCFFRDYDGIGRVVQICKDMSLSEDGRVYTFTLRRGARWSDGYPLTMEDVRFAWEDLNLNREYIETLPLIMIDPITGEGPDFKVLDDVTFSLTFDTANYTLIESKSGSIFSGTKGCTGGNPCFYSASHVYKRYHPKYGDSKEIKLLMRYYNKQDWKGLMETIQQKREFVGIPTIPVPTEFDPDYIYKGEHYIPYTGGFITTKSGDLVLELERNHYFMGVDPVGNQLPYMDGITSFLTESREVGVFKSMAGESDSGGGDMILSELPLYLANMEKGDYSLQIYRGTSGSDATIILNQEYNEDPELGRLLRSKDFRIALSLGWNRAATNETVLSGLGTPQNWTPHPSTPYYPGLEWATLDIEHDPERANRLLDGLGLFDTDGDGIRNRADGKGNVELYMEAARQHFSMIQLLQQDWGEIGIKLNIREGTRSFTAAERNKQYFVLSGSSYGENPWQVAWTRLIPLMKGNPIGPTIGEYYQTGGREGMSPSGPDEEYLPLAPEGTYPADSTGVLKEMQGFWTEGREYSQFSPRRIELGKSIYERVASEKYHIGGIGFTGISRGIRLKRNNFRNTPKNHFPSAFGGITEVFYFEDGIDNLNHPGNKSKRYKSISFIDPEYWD